MDNHCIYCNEFVLLMKYNIYLDTGIVMIDHTELEKYLGKRYLDKLGY